MSLPPKAADAAVHRILLVEDSDIDAEFIAMHLERAGLRCHLLRARNKADFLRLLQEERLDLVLADYSLPDFNGLDALDAARAQRPDVPVVFVSGVAGEELATDTLRRGATDYVVKRNLSRLPGSITRALAETRERVQRRQAEAALVKSEANMRLALEAAHLGLWQLRRDGALTWDARCAAMLGLPAEVPVSLANLLQRVHVDDRETLAEAVHVAQREPLGVGLSVECRVRQADGSQRWVVIRGRGLHDEADAIGAADEGRVRLTGVMQDVTDARLLASRQRHSEILFKMAAQVTGLGIWEIGASADQVWLDEGYRRIAGLEGGEVHDLGALIHQAVHPDDRAMVMTALRTALAAAGPDDLELEHRLVHPRDGRVSWVAIKGRRLPDDEGAHRLVGTARDITEQRRLQKVLQASNEELERRVAERTRELTAEIAERGRVEETLQQMQRLEAVGQLTSGVAHDFNNLLAVVLSNISLIGRLLQQQPGADARVMQRLESMRSAAQRGATLTRQLLAFSRRQRLEPQSVDFNDIVMGMRDLLQTTLGGSVHLQTELAIGLWPALVDPTQMELIILNLAINARDAMEVGGRLMLRTANTTLTAPPARPEEPEPGDYVALSVSDTGTGMPESVLAKVFEPFFTTKEVGKGSGLGLAQVFGFAKQSGGGVRIDTHLGKGTTVTVYMPRAARSLAQAVSAGQGAGDGTAASPLAQGAESPRLLLVDDDHAVREATASLLALHGYQVEEASGAAMALERLQDGGEVDLVLCDFAMPLMNGAEMAAAIRQRHPHMPVVFLTGYADLRLLKDVPERFLLQKPVDETELVERLREALQT